MITKYYFKYIVNLLKTIKHFYSTYISKKKKKLKIKVK